MNAHGYWLGTLVAGVLVVGTAWAQSPSATFLSPDECRVGLGDTVKLRVEAGNRGEARPTDWPSDVAWLMVRNTEMQRNAHHVKPTRAGEQTVDLKIEQPGVTLVGMDLATRKSKLDAGALRQFVDRHGGPALKAATLPTGKVNVRHYSSAKTLIRVSDDNGETTPSVLGTDKTGQKVEIRPVFDPSAARVGTDLPMWVYVAGSKREGLKVEATHVATGQTVTFVTGRGGNGHWRIPAAGRWQVEVHHAEPWTRDNETDWVLYSGTLTFEVGGKGATK